jgi:molybdopterin-binding protein
MNPTPPEPAVHYARCVEMIARRLRVLDTFGTEATHLAAESYALHVGKVVEGIASAAARVAEQGGGPSVDLRTLDADKVLARLHAKGLLVLPKAEDIGKSDQPGLAVVISGAPIRDLEVMDLKQAFRASADILRSPYLEVVLDVGGQEIVSVITRSSAEHLGLVVGDDVRAIVKSTEVMILK